MQQQQLLKFNYVTIRGSKNLHHLVRRWTVALTTVKEIELRDVHDEFLPPLGLLPCLEKLKIASACKVKNVGDEFLGIGNYDEHKGGDRGRAFIAFPMLKKLLLYGFDGWEEWEDPQVQGTDDHIIIMPSLCELRIYGSKLKSLPHFLVGVPLQKLAILNSEMDEMPRIAHVEDEACKTSTTLAQNVQEMDLAGVINMWVPYWRNYCCSLRVLRLSYCSEASLLGLGALPSLENLTVVNCVGTDRVGKEVMLWTIEDVEDMMQGRVMDGGGDTPTRRQSQQSSSSSCNTSMVSFPSLKFLELNSMKDWKEWEDPPQLGTNRAITIMPSLRVLVFMQCPQLKALPTFLQKVHVRQLSITNCDTLETWWEKEAGEDWLNWKSKISQVEINRLWPWLTSDPKCY